MTTYYHEDGTAESVTAVEVGPCVVTQVKTEARDGYEAVQLGFGSARRLNSPEAGHQDRSGRRFTHLQEFGVDDLSEFEVGQEIKADVFEIGASEAARRHTVSPTVTAPPVQSEPVPHRDVSGPAKKCPATTVSTGSLSKD
jgi:hypothetical protein